MSSNKKVEEECECFCELCQKTNLGYNDGRFFGKDHDIFYCHKCADNWEFEKKVKIEYGVVNIHFPTAKEMLLLFEMNRKR